MMDVETESLWSHILGEAMSGELKGTQLESIPSEMLTWSEWKALYPQTTVLNLPPTRHTEYTKSFYERKPEAFVYGALILGRPFHVSWPDLQAKPIANVDVAKRPLLIVLDKQSTVVRLLQRELDGKKLTFESAAGGESARLKDLETGSLWTLAGECLEGPLKGKRLDPVAGLMSFRKAWDIFHPKSKPFFSK